MKLVQINIWQGKLGKQIIDLLNDEKPDFVCMQEVNDLKGGSGYKFFSTLDEIKQEAGFDHVFMSPTYASQYMNRTMEYGNAMLSRLPFVKTETLFTRGEYMTGFDVEERDGNIRNLQVAAVEIGSKRLNLLNHHGHWIYGTKAGDDETLRQMALIAEAVRGLEGPVIMCGDFNLAPGSTSIGLINEQLTNLSAKHGLKRTYTELSVVDEVCDYIFVNDHIKVHNFKESGKLVSDHKALILEFDLQTG